ncbi:hypothetical protein QEN19_002358 [Hanseniaspora menglaensis]
MNFHQRRVLFVHTTKNLAYVSLIGLSIAIIIKTTNRLKREHKFSTDGEKTEEDKKVGRNIEGEDSYLEYYKKKAGQDTVKTESSLATDQQQYIEQIKQRKRGPRLTYSLWDQWFGKNE